MGGTGGFPIDLILFGMIAAFLVLRLRSILGKRTGFERPAQPVSSPQPRNAAPPVVEGVAEPAVPSSSRQMPDPSSQAGQALSRMQALDPSFDAGAFLGGAEQAFRMIVAAFASGDRQALQALLSPETYQAFEQAISAREAAGHTQVTEIHAIQSLSVDSAEIKDSTGAISVRIVSDQVSYTLDQNRHPVVGTEAVTEITDIWSFERDLKSQDPTWRLVAARSA